MTHHNSTSKQNIIIVPICSGESISFKLLITGIRNKDNASNCLNFTYFSHNNYMLLIQIQFKTLEIYLPIELPHTQIRN